MKTGTLTAAALACFLAAAPAFAQEIPRPAPDQAITLTDGSTKKLSDYRGKVVAVLYILTYCPHCQHTVELMNGIQSELGRRGFQAFACAVNSDAKQQLPAFMAQYKPEFPVGVCPIMDAARLLQLSPDVRPLVPFLAFIDRTGQIRFQTTGADEQFFGDNQAQNIREEALKLLNDRLGKKTVK